MVNLSHYFASWVQWEVQEGQSACAACPHHLKTVRFQSSNFNSMLLISLGLSPPGGAFSNAWGSDRDNLRKKECVSHDEHNWNIEVQQKNLFCSFCSCFGITPMTFSSDQGLRYSLPIQGPKLQENVLSFFLFNFSLFVVLF